MVVRLTGDLGRPGIWDRIRSAQSEWFERARPALPGTTNVPSYADMLAEAGLELLESRTLTDTVIAPDEPALRTLIAGYLRRAERNLDGILDVADLEALRSRGRDPQHADSGWGDAEVTSSRTLFIAQRNYSLGLAAATVRSCCRRDRISRRSGRSFRLGASGRCGRRLSPGGRAVRRGRRRCSSP